MTKEESINILIKDCDTNKISDGYHTFEELYEHRIVIYIELCKWMFTLSVWHSEISEFLDYEKRGVWKSKKHSDGSEWGGWFILGIGYESGRQITYHLPISKWNDCGEIPEIEKAPEWDGHTSADVLERLKQL